MLMTSLTLFSQGQRRNPPHPNGNGQGGPPKPELPVDGGRVILIIVGTIYGVFTLQQKK